MRKIIIPNPDLTHTEKTFLDADYSTGTTLTVVNNFGFANDDYVIVGAPGEEKTETMDVTAYVGDTQLTISAALQFSHNKGCVVYRYEYNQLEIYRYRSSAWTLISTSDIQWDKRETIYIDRTGLSTDSYRYRLYNSASTESSDYSPTVAATGFTRSQVGYMVREVRKIIGDTERIKIKTDDEIIRQFNRAQEIIQSVRSDWWFLRDEDATITTVAGTKKYSLATITDLNYIDTVRYRYNDGTTDETYQLLFKPMLEHDYDVRDNSTAATNRDDRPSSYTILPADSSSDTGYLELNIASKTTAYGTLYIRFFKDMADLDDVADETDVPIPSILEDFALAYCFRILGEEDRAKTYEDRFYGPQPGRNEEYKSPYGIRMLERMQSQKAIPQGQPQYLKRWIGRRAVSTLFGDQSVDRDYLKENYF